MPRKKKTELEDVEIPELDEEVADEEEAEVKPETSDEKWKKIFQLMETFRTAIEANQKYVRKLWDRLKVAEDNFRIHLDQEE